MSRDGLESANAITGRATADHNFFFPVAEVTQIVTDPVIREQTTANATYNYNLLPRCVLRLVYAQSQRRSLVKI